MTFKDLGNYHRRAIPWNTKDDGKKFEEYTKVLYFQYGRVLFYIFGKDEYEWHGIMKKINHNTGQITEKKMGVFYNPLKGMNKIDDYILSTGIDPQKQDFHGKIVKVKIDNPFPGTLN